MELLLALLLLLVSVLLVVELLKSIVLISVDSDVTILLFGRLVVDSLLSFMESLPNEKDAIHSPVIIGSEVKPDTSRSSSDTSRSSYSDR